MGTIYALAHTNTSIVEFEEISIYLSIYTYILSIYTYVLSIFTYIYIYIYTHIHTYM